MEPVKKISFGFSKTNKKPLIFNKSLDKKVDYIVSLEGQSVKLKDESKEVEKAPLVIPLKDNQTDLLQRVRDMKAKQQNTRKNSNDPVEEDNRPDSDLTIEELAAREIVKEAKQKLVQNDTSGSKNFVIFTKKADELPLEGKMESTLVDYENIPVNDFGLAMLRGMGWKEGMSIGKNTVKTSAVKAPDLRPKGLGLGARVLINSETSLQPVIDNNGQALVLKKGCYARIIAGNNKGSYCEVQGLDDEAGRVVVKTSLKSNILTLNEFMLVAVTKEEYLKSSKVISTCCFYIFPNLQYSCDR
ncbi:G-patch domain and KOW motifs-containing protein isoform X3 [Diabrotica virgifera virgifera]|uniref:G-patch domain-containing protein n=1 Tax=Diabrotica virgifera virgifera TaxID=50390 RepID=A0ABM5K2H3_DIAVI|nr:G-patch domain and KOW motifs-containing protein isoform X3 [Diabrotica virgifera virgifera]